MEPRFGHSFGQVRVHTDSRAADYASRLNADAYTVDQSIVFDPDQYRPDSPEGRTLIAHELAHVVQGMKSQAPGEGLSSPGDRAEAEARLATVRVTRGESVHISESPAAALQRQEQPWRQQYDAALYGTHSRGATRPQSERVSMALDDTWLEGDVVDFEGDIVTGERSPQAMKAFADALDSNLRHVRADAERRLNFYVAMVDAGVSLFEGYAADRLSEMAGRASGKALLNLLINVAFLPVGGAVTARIASSATKQVVNQVVSQVRDSVKNAASADYGSTHEGLQSAVSHSAETTRFSAITLRDEVFGSFDARVKEMSAKLAPARRMMGELGSFTSGEHELINDFHEASIEESDSRLERYGVPSQESGQSIQLEVFSKLVENFERARILATAGMREHIEMSSAEMFESQARMRGNEEDADRVYWLTLEGRTQARKDAAVQHRRKQMDRAAEDQWRQGARSNDRN